MAATADQLPGIEIEVDDLVRVRGQLSGMTLAAIRRRASYRSGARDTRNRGRGMEYEESRAYVAGDDVRTMDWRVMARTGEAHTKVYAEEKERRFLLAVDLSASMYFGTRRAFKSWAAAHAAAHLGWLACFAGDRIGGLVVAPDSHHEVRPGKASRSLLAVFHHLADASRETLPPANRESRLNFLLRELSRVVKPGSIIALISDFIGLDDESLEILSTLARHNDINVFWIHDRLETGAWASGYYPLIVDGRRGGIEITAEAAWLRECQCRHRERIENLCSSLNLPLAALSCNQDINRQLLRALGY